MSKKRTRTLNGIPIEEIKERAKLPRKNDLMVLTGGRSLLIKIAQRDGLNCCYCKTHLFFNWMGNSVQGHRAATYEHVTPKSQGGKKTFKNGKLACSHCNRHRGTQDIPTFVALLNQGYYEKDVVRARQIAKIELSRTNEHANYLIRVRKRKWAARKLWVVNAWKTLYNVFVYEHGDAELG